MKLMSNLFLSNVIMLYTLLLFNINQITNKPIKIGKRIRMYQKDTLKIEQKSDTLKSIIIGDSQTPFVDNASEKVSRISTTPGMSSLWQGGKTLTWLISALEKYPTDITIGDVVFCIGTNGGYSSKDNVERLITLTKEKFPNSKLYAVQGSWGWGGIKDVTETRVRTYYKRFEELGVTIIEPPIGKIEPHGNKPIYKVIGKELDSLL
jgi:hypothetical protein